MIVFWMISMYSAVCAGVLDGSVSLFPGAKAWHASSGCPGKASEYIGVIVIIMVSIIKEHDAQHALSSRLPSALE